MVVQPLSRGEWAKSCSKCTQARDMFSTKCIRGWETLSQAGFCIGQTLVPLKRCPWKVCRANDDGDSTRRASFRRPLIRLLYTEQGDATLRATAEYIADDRASKHSCLQHIFLTSLRDCAMDRCRGCLDSRSLMHPCSSRRSFSPGKQGKRLWAR